MTTLIDESCFSDIFTMQSQTLDDFEFGLEATNIDSLLELFEEREKRSLDSTVNLNDNNVCNNIIKSNTNVTLNSITISSPKVRKSTISSSNEKRKGTSLLAKPKKNNSRRSLINITDSELHSFSSCFPRDHDYCLISEDTKLYNKLPDYITTFKGVSQQECMPTSEESDHFVKIPNCFKEFLNFNDDLKNINIDENDFLNKNDGNILIELNEAFIEVSDFFFDDKVCTNDDNKMQEYSGEDFNSMSDTSNYSSLTTSADSEDNKRLNDILNGEHLLPQDIEQNDYKNNTNVNNSNENDDKQQISGKSRSRSRESRPKNYSNTKRRRRLSTRSSVDSSSQSSRSSSCSSCSSCTSFSSKSSNESKINYNHSNSIRNDNNKGQQCTRKRTLKESYCQNNYSKIRHNFANQNRNEMVNKLKNARNPIIRQTIKAKKDIEERKIIYVGKIPEGTTKTDIRHWFGHFGAIKEVSIHFRDYGDNYAFVTFFRRCDAFEAIEHANEDTRHPNFDLSFGGRRQFCKTRYEDLDFAEDDTSFSSERMDFDALLRSTQAKLNR